MYLGAATYPGATTYPGVDETPARDITIRAAAAPCRFTATIGADVPRTIPVSLGAVEYLVVDVTEVNGLAVTASEMRMALGAHDDPGAWQTPDVATNPTASTAQLSLLIGEAHYLPPGGPRLWPWVRISDDPEVVPVRLPNSITIT